MLPKIPLHKTFNGKQYASTRAHKKKKVAKKWAESYRVRGKLARITTIKGHYIVWVY